MEWIATLFCSRPGLEVAEVRVDEKQFGSLPTRGEQRRFNDVNGRGLHLRSDGVLLADGDVVGKVVGVLRQPREDKP